MCLCECALIEIVFFFVYDEWQFNRLLSLLYSKSSKSEVPNDWPLRSRYNAEYEKRVASFENGC